MDQPSLSVADNLAALQPHFGGGSRLVAVSKTKPLALLRDAYAAGQRDFGENKVQEMAGKQAEMPADVRWHMIGHLQSNKVKYLAPFVHLIHSVDSLKLLREVDKQGRKADRRIDCLLQIHIAAEETKFGLSEEELHALLQDEGFAGLQHARVVGLMGMATLTDSHTQVRREFRGLRKLFERCRDTYAGPNLDWRELSMGMSGDYPIALEEGSTLVRIGSALFGAR
ncbi:MAG: YggS family pyridoxal phosphate-dependent enzyme [Catalinimonas sp.]